MKKRKNYEKIIETFETLKKAFNKFDFHLSIDNNSFYTIDSTLLLNVLKENFINKIGAFLPENILLTKINFIASTIEGTISEDTNGLNILREVQLWEETHLLNQVGTHKSEYYYSKGFLLVQVKAENADKLLYFPNPALSKEIAESIPNNAQFLVIKNTAPTMSSLNFLINDYEDLILSDDKKIKWTITPIFSINNSFMKGNKAEFIRYVQRGNISPSIELTDYKKVLKQALDLQKQKLKDEVDMDE